MATKKVQGLHFQSEEKRKPKILAAALLDDGSLHDLVKRDVEEDYDKLLLLCKQYGIERGESMFVQLSLALAREIYPEPKKRGRKSKWTDLKKGALVVEVERLVNADDPAHGVEWACRQLAKREPWASFLEAKEGSGLGSDPAEALRQIYFKFRNDKWATVSRDAFKQYEAEGAITIWEEQVSHFVKNSYLK
ncbi:MAG: hypothetical protein WC284_06275 [Candidimonas sp.]